MDKTYCYILNWNNRDDDGVITKFYRNLDNAKKTLLEDYTFDLKELVGYTPEEWEKELQEHEDEYKDYSAFISNDHLIGEVRNYARDEFVSYEIKEIKYED